MFRQTLAKIKYTSNKIIIKKYWGRAVIRNYQYQSIREMYPQTYSKREWTR